MPVIEFVRFLATRYSNLLRIDHNNVIAHVNMWRIHDLVLATQTMCDGGCKTTESVFRGVNNEPVVLNILLSRAFRPHESSVPDF